MSGDGFASHDGAIAVLANPPKAAAVKATPKGFGCVWRRANPPGAQLRAQTTDLGSGHSSSPGCGEESHDNLRLSASERACRTPGLRLSGWRSPVMEFVRVFWPKRAASHQTCPYPLRWRRDYNKQLAAASRGRRNIARHAIFSPVYPQAEQRAFEAASRRGEALERSLETRS
jgi:hypothetical protein